MNRFLKGNVSLPVAIAGAIATVVVGGFSAYATSSSRVSNVEAQVQVLQRTQELQYREVKEGIGRIETKLDQVLK